MKTQKKLSKVFNLILAAFLAVMVLTTTVSANSNAGECKETSGLGAAFGCGTILGKDGTISVTSIVTLVFRIILYAAILWTVWNVVLAGIKIAGAKEDADKRKEGIQAVINAVIGLVVALLAFGIVTTVVNQVGGGAVEVTTTPCTATSSGGSGGANVGFTGFVKDGAPNTCVLLDANGGVIYEGTIK